MIIAIDVNEEPARIVLEEPETFTAFSVAATGPEQRFPGAVAAVGRYDGEHVFVRPDALRELAGELARDETWEQNLAGMLGYAAKKGWLDAEGAIQAHVTRR